MRGRRLGLLVTAALVAGWGSLVAVPAAYASSPPPVPEARLSSPAAPPGSKSLGSLDPGALLTVEVVLAPAHPAAAASLIASLYSPGSPNYHHWLTAAESAQVFSPAPAAVAGVTSWLAGRGLKHSTRRGTVVQVEASAGQLTSAFGVSLRRYAGANGHQLFSSVGAPHLPASVAANVSALVGLDDVAAATPNIAIPRRAGSSSLSVPQAIGDDSPCQPAATYASTNRWYTNDELGASYGIDAMIASGQNGSGVTVAIPEFSAYSPDDVAAYTGCFGLTNPITSVLVDSGSPADPAGGTPEADLDIEQVATQAPGASLAVYTAPNTPAGEFDLWNAIVNDDTASVISYSWGMCELDEGANMTSALDGLFQQAAVQGQTVLAASGDSGSEACYPSRALTTLYTSYPASDPWVTAVGGTDVDASGQTTWNYCQTATDVSCAQAGNDAAGGGLSQFSSKPMWQPTITTWPAGFASCGIECRQVPDVAANAGVGEVFYIGGTWVGEAGTSLVAPVVAGLVADRNSGCTDGRQGDWAQSLYQDQAAGLGPTMFDDITRGDNDLTRTNDGQYPAEAGYDLATGLGTPKAAGLSCAEALSVVPPHALPGATVTITGIGLSGATVAFGTTPARVVATSPTSAQVVVPAGLGPVNVTASGRVGDGTATARFSFDRPPPPVPTCPARRDISVGSVPWVLTAMQGSNGCLGYWMATQAGQVATFGAATFHGDLSGVHLNGQIVGMSTTPDSGGYWMLGADGGVFAFGDAGFFGSTGALRLNKPVVGMAATPSGRGYWLVASDGGVFAFGDAGFFGSTGAVRLNKPVVGMAATPSGRGYWLVASDGGVFAFGDAGFFGSTGALRLAKPVVGMTAGPGGLGYRLVASDGGIFSFGAAVFYGSLGANPPAAPITTMAASVDGRGYYLTGVDGDVYAFGDAPYLGRAVVS